ncbi:unnamed protein product [Durusdinium trenchii]|uniref:Uncharacterized protein n=1 Tax=Durusdinium trenchii TaxID=1381693 RepID=A0ABP0HVW7_9DINO
MGQRKRSHRQDFLQELGKLSNSITSKKVCFQGREPSSVLEENGVTRLLLRDWCNGNFKTQFNLKSTMTGRRRGQNENGVAMFGVEWCCDVWCLLTVRYCLIKGVMCHGLDTNR